MWVVEFESNLTPAYWMTCVGDLESEDDAMVRMVMEKFNDPEWEYRIREVKD